MDLQRWWPIFLAIPKLRITDFWWATCFKLSRCLGAIWEWQYTYCIAMWIIFLTILVQWERRKENDSIRTSKRWKSGIKGTKVTAWSLTTAGVWYTSAWTLHSLREPKKRKLLPSICFFIEVCETTSSVLFHFLDIYQLRIVVAFLTQCTLLCHLNMHTVWK